MTTITIRMLHDYLGNKDGDAGQFRALALLAEVLNGEYDIEALRQEIDSTADEA